MSLKRKPTPVLKQTIRNCRADMAKWQSKNPEQAKRATEIVRGYTAELKRRGVTV